MMLELTGAVRQAAGPNLRLWLIPILPLIGAAINGLLGKRFSRPMVSAVALIFCGAAFLKAVLVAARFPSLSLPHIETVATWLRSGNFSADFAFYLDQLSLVMLLVVTGVGFLIHIYSVGYMWDEGGFYRFFCYLNLFMFFMLTLVLASNYLLMFIGWEGVGLASYLLIGFFFLRDSAASAGKKAFIVNRIGDFGFLIALFLIIQHFGSLDFSRVFNAIAGNPHQYPTEASGAGLLTAIAVLLMVGACGKSAQIPLYVWLPDAMEGPTPVSALIHAATMVTAGVYMVSRSHLIFEHAPTALMVVAIIGTLTAFFAATIGIAQTDIKKVLAYSTISQLGYMFMACGVAAFSAGIFHLMTHAFFKALLFLAAGSVIHSVGGEQDMRKMGGLRKHIPVTFWTMTIATFAIAGIFPFAGFFSKDEILWRDYQSNWVYWAVGLVTAFLTSFYMFRLWFMTFFGEYRGTVHASHGQEEHTGHETHLGGDEARRTVSAAHDEARGHSHAGIHESPWVMLAPLVILAVLSIVGGWIGWPRPLGGSDHFDNFLRPAFQVSAPAANAEYGRSEETTPSEQTSEGSETQAGKTEVILAGIAMVTAIFGGVLAWLFYSRRPDLPDRIATSAHALYSAVANKYWIDELYGWLFVKPLIAISTVVFWRGIDQGVIDATLDGSADGARELSDSVRRMQSGNVRSYAAWVAIGATAVIAYMVWVATR